jgi:dihydroorotase
MMGGALDPHLHCKPALKGQKDRKALRDAVFGGANRVFFGSDSAPHPRAAKEGGRAASGVWSSPSALCALAAVFEAEGALSALEPFVAAPGAAFYRLPPPRGELVLVRQGRTVPPELDGAVPMLAGRGLPWRLGRITAT